MFISGTYACTFVGRRKGATGITYPIVEIVECPFLRVVPTLYQKYEHITQLKIVSSDNKPMSATVAIEMAEWMPGE